MIRKQRGRYDSIAIPIGALGVVLLAMLSLAIFVYGDGGMALATVSAQDVDEEAMTKAYVDGAIEYYSDRGLGKTVERYGNPLSWDGERYLIVADAETHVLVSSPLLYLNGRGVDALVPGGQLSEEIDSATERGHWFDADGLNIIMSPRYISWSSKMVWHLCRRASRASWTRPCPIRRRRLSRTTTRLRLPT